MNGGTSHDAGVKVSQPGVVGANDLVIVGPGVLGRMVAETCSSSFLFTSSTAAYDCSDNGFCNEDSPIVPIGTNPRTDVLLKAENTTLEAGGCIPRLAGLYKADRGAHVYWLKKGSVNAHPDHILNLIHYEEAASLLITVMQNKFRGRIFLGCDNHPLSRQEIIDFLNQSGQFNKKLQGFTGTDGPLGKRMDNSKTLRQTD
ncbi:uncharacterized protein LOC120104256 [Phoenix dactylifera]|uniref:Uncharacterized protein LOC120104256 n=1 Tax=Phoenix dactylifera TaxID=42345 RepID=A0A8B8ZAE4_PHODC|nr:uncharacterized protein LOC120104256 [Phoenix dactylifera]